MNHTEFDKRADAFLREGFSEMRGTFGDVNKTVRTGFRFAFFAWGLTLVLLLCAVVTAIWAMGHYMFHTW